jgi:hypothetical protein
LPLDETESQRILRNVRRRDLVPEVVIMIFHTVFPEYLQNEYAVDLARRARPLPPHTIWNQKFGGRGLHKA